MQQPLLPEDTNDFIRRNQSGFYDTQKSYQAVKKIHHPGNPGTDAYKDSGVTIGYGVDLGQRSPQSIQKLLNGALPQEEIDAIKKAANLRGDQARKFVKYNQIVLPKEACKIIFERIRAADDKWLIGKCREADFKKKFGIKNGDQFLKGLPNQYKKVLLDFKYWGKNKTQVRAQIIPFLKQISQGTAKDVQVSKLNNILNSIYEKNGDRHKSFKDLMKNSQQNKPDQKKSNQFLNNLVEKNQNPQNISAISNSINGKSNIKMAGIEVSFDVSKTYFDGFYIGSKMISLHQAKNIKNSFLMKDLIVPLMIMYDTQIKSKNIAVSIDPHVPTDPDGPLSQKVFYPQQLKGTEYGKLMIEADYIMKQLKMGVNEKNQPFKYPASLVKIGLTFDNLTKQLHSNFTERTRQWIVIKKVEEIKVQGNRVILGDVKMEVEAKMREINEKGVLEDSQKDLSGVTRRFCDIFTENYDVICKEYHQFARIKQLAKASIIARAMYVKGIQVNIPLITQLYNLQKCSDNSTSLLNTLHHQKTFQQRNFKIRIVGGMRSHL